MTVVLGPGLVVAIVVLLALAMLASRIERLGLERQQLVGAVRAVLQLSAVSLVVTAAVSQVYWAALFSLAMFVVAVRTTTTRVKVTQAWPWAALAMLAGIIPVLATIFASGAAPINGITIIALSGIVIGNMMTSHTLVGRRSFAHLRDNHDLYEACLALGVRRRNAIDFLIRPVIADALVPHLDTTKTVGLVTLPGAFIGVLLGGGSPIQAGITQVLVMISIMTGQTLTVVTATALIRQARLLPPDLKAALQP